MRASLLALRGSCECSGDFGQAAIVNLIKAAVDHLSPCKKVRVLGHWSLVKRFFNVPFGLSNAACLPCNDNAAVQLSSVFQALTQRFLLVVQSCQGKSTLGRQRSSWRACLSQESVSCCVKSTLRQGCWGICGGHGDFLMPGGGTTLVEESVVESAEEFDQARLQAGVKIALGAGKFTFPLCVTKMEDWMNSGPRVSVEDSSEALEETGCEPSSLRTPACPIVELRLTLPRRRLISSKVMDALQGQTFARTLSLPFSFPPCPAGLFLSQLMTQPVRPCLMKSGLRFLAHLLVRAK